MERLKKSSKENVEFGSILCLVLFGSSLRKGKLRLGLKPNVLLAFQFVGVIALGFTLLARDFYTRIER